MRNCIDCRDDISFRGNRAIRCEPCQERYEYKSNNIRKKKWRRKHDKMLGNPEQDNEILKFIRNKRYKIKNKKYNALPNSAFYKKSDNI